MDAKKEQALVGLFVLVAAGLLVFTILLLSGRFNTGFVPYRAYFKNAGGLEPGAQVRFAGGPSVGHVNNVTSDPRDSTRMEVDFDVKPGVPVKTDSLAEITSTTPLADNFLGIRPGSAAAPRAPAGAVLRSTEYSSFADLTTLVAQLGPSANDLLENLNDRTTQLEKTLDRVNDLLSDQNRANLSASFGHIRGMLDEDRPAVHGTLTHLNESTAKLGPLIDDFHKASAQASDALAHLDATISEDRPDLHKAIAQLRQSLDSTASLTDQLDRTVNSNSENLDEILDNFRHATENLNSFTETIKTRPYTLLRSPGVKPRHPGDRPPK